MNTQTYNRLLGWTKQRLLATTSIDQTLRAEDLIADAYLADPAASIESLKKAINVLLIVQKQQAWGRRSSVNYVSLGPTAHRSLETSKVCRICHLDKGYAAFRRRVNPRTGLEYYLNACRSCESSQKKLVYATKKADSTYRALTAARAKEYYQANRHKVLAKQKNRRSTSAYKSNLATYLALNQERIRANGRVRNERYRQRKKQIQAIN